MSLKDYRKKRNFNETNEPQGEKKPAATKSQVLEFVVQKHQASHLHYDFRLEVNGVLKSWAVPKGPSLNPRDKRLAIQVEDHPYEYRSFEGTISAGNYGAGEVIVWDAGTYETQGTESQIAQDLEKGHLNFTLQGKKLKGKFTLMRLKGDNNKQWLLIKKNDSFASTEDITQQDRSVLSNKALKLKNPPTPSSKKTKSKKTSQSSSLGKKGKIPAQIKPMLATALDQPFDDPQWLFELKWDGYRALALIQDKKAKLLSRNEQSFNTRFPMLVKELEKLDCEACLDGEIVVLDAENHPSFQLLQNYMRQPTGNLVYYIFDLIYLNGRDLRNLPLIERKILLKSLLPASNPFIRYCDHIEGIGVAFFKEAAKKGFEGIIAKRKNSPYLKGKRSSDWAKIKTHLRQEVIICGFTPPKGTREFFGSLLLGVYQDKVLTYVGHTGSGFNHQQLAGIYARLSPLIQPNSPFKKPPKQRGTVTWVKPELVCEVSFAEWTSEGIMRQAIFVDFREDKQAKEVFREFPLSLSELSPKKQKELSASPVCPIKDSEKSKLELSHLDKVFWPVEGYTKGDIIDYYSQVSSLILPYLKDRPESLRRFPNGIEKPGFFQKEAGSHPDWIKTVQINHEEHVVNYYLVEKEQDLLYLANLGCIDFNPFLSRISSLNYPDFAVLDLDPEDVDFEQVIEVALGIYDLLRKWKIPSVCKTSGKRGLHICIPLGAQYPYEDAANFGKLIAHLVHDHMPEMTSLERSPKNRQKKVYLDYLQTNFGQTIVAPYSIRPVPGAPVSTPLKWSELKAGLSPLNFTISTVLQRFKKVGDLFQLVLGPGIDIAKILKKIE